MNHITQEQAVELVNKTISGTATPHGMFEFTALCNAAIEWHIAQQKPFLNAEEYLRHKYGAYRGFHAWREIEEGYNQGRYDEAMAQGPDATHIGNVDSVCTSQERVQKIVKTINMPESVIHSRKREQL